MRIGLIQHSCGKDYVDNIETNRRGVHEAVQQGAELVVLQELHAHFYPCLTEDPAYFSLAEPIPGPTTRTLSQLSADLNVVIIGSVFEQRTAGLYHNTAVVIDRDGSIAGIYRKMHIPNDPGYYEKYYFAPGDLGFKPVKTSIGRLGVMICWDQWFPEAARLMALAGAELLVYPSAIGWNPDDGAQLKARQKQAWQMIQRSHAIANGLTLLCCNRVGLERAEQTQFCQNFWGSSFVCGPLGEILAEAPSDREATLVVDIEMGDTAETRQQWPFLRDRRIDAYKGIRLLYRD